MTLYEPQEKIVDFLAGKSGDHKGRKYTDMLTWTDAQIEDAHDSIQWLFPLHEESGHFSSAPVVTKEDVERAKSDPIVLLNLSAATKRMEQFLAIGEYDDDMLQRIWCRNRNHNLLRITRIIRSLRLFGLDTHARRFHDEAFKVANKHSISDSTLVYWRRALEDDLWKSLRG